MTAEHILAKLETSLRNRHDLKMTRESMVNVLRFIQMRESCHPKAEWYARNALAENNPEPCYEIRGKGNPDRIKSKREKGIRRQFAAYENAIESGVVRGYKLKESDVRIYKHCMGLLSVEIACEVLKDKIPDFKSYHGP